MIYEGGAEPPRELCPPDQKEISTLEDLLRENFIPTCSVMFRNGLFGEVPDWFYELPLGDWPLHVLNAEHGLIGYVNEVLAVYRAHAGGLWTGSSRRRRLLALISAYEVVNKHLKYRHQAIISATVSDFCYELATGYEDEGDTAGARAYARRCVAERVRGGRVPEGHLLGMLLRLYAPTLYKPLRGFRRLLRRGFNRAPRPLV
jgi:hypothetical protein